jgi:chromosome partitioning protein
VNRVVYPAAFTDGRTPQEVDKNSPAAREVSKLWANIKACLHVTMQEQRKAANG